MQGSPLSPLLANVALHGLETAITQAFPHRDRQHGPPPNVVVYADDLVILHQDHAVIERCHHLVSEWLRPLGLTRKPSKTRITHTLETDDGQPGFDFLGFHIRQYPVGHTTSGQDSQGRLLGFKTLIAPSCAAITRQRTTLHLLITHAKQATQHTLIGALAPHVRGWSNYYSRVVSARVFRTLDHALYAQLRSWAMSRHPNKSKHWIMGKYWRGDEGKSGRVQTLEGGAPTLPPHPPPPRPARSQHPPSPRKRHA